MTATEAEQNSRRGLASWWQGRSWSKDLETLTRLHKALRAMDADAEQELLSAPAPLAPPGGWSAPQETAGRPDAADQEAQVQELPRRQVPSHAAQPPATAAPEAERGEPGPGQQPDPVQQPAAVLEPAGGEPDPAIAAIKETFRYVADAGDKAVGFFYGQLFLRQPHLRQLFPPAMDEQRDRLFRALGRIVESLSTPDEMAAYLSQLGRDHRKYQVEPEMYEAVGTALLATLRAFARDAFTSEAQEAWTQIYVAGSSLMIKAAEQDAATSPASWTIVAIEPSVKKRVWVLSSRPHAR